MVFFLTLKLSKSFCFKTDVDRVNSSINNNKKLNTLLSKDRYIIIGIFVVFCGYYYRINNICSKIWGISSKTILKKLLTIRLLTNFPLKLPKILQLGMGAALLAEITSITSETATISNKLHA